MNLLTIEEKVGQMLFVGFDGLQPPDTILEWLARGQIGGLVLFSRNVAHPAQLAALTQACRDAAPRPILIAIDQEGGRVARLRAGFSESPGAMALGAADSEVLAERVSGVLARELCALGINWILAPVVDIAHNAENAVIGTRSLGFDKNRVRQLAAAEIRGFQSAGVVVTAKHFPGHGNTPTDTHVALAVVSASLDEMRATDLVPFEAAVEAHIESIMVSHVKFDALDSVYPSTISPAVTQGLLRDEIGFSGLVCTDCMEMKAMRDHFGVGESAVLAALAGQDVMFFSHTREYQQAAYDALLAAARSGRLPEERIDQSVSRIRALNERYSLDNRPPLDIIRCAEHLATMQEAARTGTVLVKNDAAIFPLKHQGGQRVTLVEFASYLDSEAMDRGSLTAFATLLHQEAPEIESVSLSADHPTPQAQERARQLAAESDVLVLATRNAHLWPDETERALELMSLARIVILLCLCNPYDVNVLPGARVILCTCGDATPSLQAAADALLGRFTPSGRLPVPVSQV